MKPILTPKPSRIVVAAASVCVLMWSSAHAAEPKPVAPSASQVKAKKPTTAKTTQADECNTSSNNPTGKTDQGGNVLIGKKPSGPKCPQDVSGKVAAPAAK